MSMMGGGLNGGFNMSLQAMISAAHDAGFEVNIGSGFRSHERQQQLWDAAVKKYGSEEAADDWVARPGHSNHEKGIAADLQFGNAAAREWVHGHARQFGLFFPMDWEPWHIEPLGSRGMGDRGSYTNPPPGQANPVDVVDDPHDLGTQMGNMIAMLSGGQVQGTEALATPEPTAAATVQDVTPDIKDQGTSGTYV